MSAYYNELDPFNAEWLRNLISIGAIADGEVDERSITDVDPRDLDGFAQCHFFAGVGGWSLALRIAGWPDGRRVWTGSCPCQPVSGAGRRKGHADERHLWPAFHGLIAERQPAVVFGEQVGGKIGREWLAAVRADLEATGHACGASDLCAAGVGAPHIRQRLYWLAKGLADADGLGRRQVERALARRPGELPWGAGIAGRLDDADGPRRQEHRGSRKLHLRPQDREAADQRDVDPGVAGGLADSQRVGRQRRRPGEAGDGRGRPFPAVDGLRPAGGLADAGGGRALDRPGQGEGAQTPPDGLDGHLARDGLWTGLQGQPGRLADTDHGRQPPRGLPVRRGQSGQAAAVEYRPGEDLWSGPNESFWRDADWIFCRDGRWRPIEPGSFPLATGVPARVGRLRAYGNAIVPQVAAIFVEACMELL